MLGIVEDGLEAVRRLFADNDSGTIEAPALVKNNPRTAAVAAAVVVATAGTPVEPVALTEPTPVQQVIQQVIEGAEAPDIEASTAKIKTEQADLEFVEQTVVPVRGPLSQLPPEAQQLFLDSDEEHKRVQEGLGQVSPASQDVISFLEPLPELPESVQALKIVFGVLPALPEAVQLVRIATDIITSHEEVESVRGPLPELDLEPLEQSIDPLREEQPETQSIELVSTILPELETLQQVVDMVSGEENESVIEPAIQHGELDEATQRVVLERDVLPALRETHQTVVGLRSELPAPSPSDQQISPQRANLPPLDPSSQTIEEVRAPLVDLGAVSQSIEWIAEVLPALEPLRQDIELGQLPDPGSIERRIEWVVAVLPALEPLLREIDYADSELPPDTKRVVSMLEPFEAGELDEATQLVVLERDVLPALRETHQTIIGLRSELPAPLPSDQQISPQRANLPPLDPSSQTIEEVRAPLVDLGAVSQSIEWIAEVLPALEPLRQDIELSSEELPDSGDIVRRIEWISDALPTLEPAIRQLIYAGELPTVGPVEVEIGNLPALGNLQMDISDLPDLSTLTAPLQVGPLPQPSTSAVTNRSETTITIEKIEIVVPGGDPDDIAGQIDDSLREQLRSLAEQADSPIEV